MKPFNLIAGRMAAQHAESVASVAKSHFDGRQLGRHVEKSHFDDKQLGRHVENSEAMLLYVRACG